MLNEKYKINLEILTNDSSKYIMEYSILIISIYMGELTCIHRINSLFMNDFDNPYPANISGPENVSAYYICCRYPDAIQNSLPLKETYIMNPDQTAPSDLGPFCLQYRLLKHLRR